METVSTSTKCKAELTIDAQYDTVNNSDFQENLVSLSRQESVYQYTSDGDIGKLDTIDLLTIKSSNKKDDLIKAYEYFSESYIYADATKSDVVHAIYSLPFEKLYSPSCLSSNSLWDMIEVTKKFEVINTHGYSQGDSAEIIVPHVLTDIWGSTRAYLKEQCKKGLIGETRGDLHIELSHYLWDSPIVGSLSLSYSYMADKKEKTVTVAYSNYADDESIREALTGVGYEMDIDSACVIATLEFEMGTIIDQKDKENIIKLLDSVDDDYVDYGCMCA